MFADDLARVIWANAPGARLFAGNGIASLLEREVSAKHPFIKQLALAVQQVEDKPVVMSEWTSSTPNWNKVEAAPLWAFSASRGSIRARRVPAKGCRRRIASGSGTDTPGPSAPGGAAARQGAPRRRGGRFLLRGR